MVPSSLLCSAWSIGANTDVLNSGNILYMLHLLAGTDILRKAEEDQQKRLKELSEDGVSRNTKTEKHSDGGTTTTNTTVTTHRTKGNYSNRHHT